MYPAVGVEQVVRRVPTDVERHGAVVPRVSPVRGSRPSAIRSLRIVKSSAPASRDAAALELVDERDGPVVLRVGLVAERHAAAERVERVHRLARLPGLPLEAQREVRASRKYGSV